MGVFAKTFFKYFLFGASVMLLVLTLSSGDAMGFLIAVIVMVLTSLWLFNGRSNTVAAPAADATYDMFDIWSETNPATGLRMTAGGCDTDGNAYGCSRFYSAD